MDDLEEEGSLTPRKPARQAYEMTSGITTNLNMMVKLAHKEIEMVPQCEKNEKIYHKYCQFNVIRHPCLYVWPQIVYFLDASIESSRYTHTHRRHTDMKYNIVL